MQPRLLHTAKAAFLIIALLRMLFRIPLPPLLVCFDILVFIFSLFVPKDFLCVAFDAGGVTTGPMTAARKSAAPITGCTGLRSVDVTDALLIMRAAMGLIPQSPRAAMDVNGAAASPPWTRS